VEKAREISLSEYGLLRNFKQREIDRENNHQVYIKYFPSMYFLDKTTSTLTVMEHHKVMEHNYIPI
jgi:hypothetical protein